MSRHKKEEYNLYTRNEFAEEHVDDLPDVIKIAFRRKPTWVVLKIEDYEELLDVVARSSAGA